MPEFWQVTIAPDPERLHERGFLDDAGEGSAPAVTGFGATPELARADARRRLGAWLEALELLEEAERGAPE